MPYAAARRIALAVLFVAAALVAGCRGETDSFEGPEAPRFTPPAAKARIALVLGSGGPRGFAHVGALKALEEAGIRPDLVVGSSAGALVGALYASGISARDLEALAREVSVADFFEMRMVTGAPGTGRALQDYVNRHVGMRPIERFRVPFAAVATRIRDGKLAIFNHGDAGAAVRASSASPGQFEPVGILGERYVDGDEASPVPIAAARALGARIVIAVDVSAYLSSTPAGVPAEWVAKDERRARQIAGESGAADVLVHPDLGYYAGHSEEYRRRIIALAEEATRARIPEIRAAMARAASQASTVASSPSAEAAR